MNFRKTSKRPLTPPHPIFGKKCCVFVWEIGARSAFPLPKKRNIIFRIGNDPPPHSEVFRKFIDFGPGSHPLGSLSEKKRDYVGKNSQTGGGGLTQTNFLMSIYQFIFGMPK